MFRSRHPSTSVPGLVLVCASAVAVGTEARGDVEAQSPAGESAGFSQSVNDAAITARVKSRLLWSSRTDGLDLSVSTERGEVTLSGKVDDHEEAEHAREIAANTAGVSAVRTRFQVGETGLDAAQDKAAATARKVKRGVDDAWISAKVTKTIMFDKRFIDTRVDVDTENGVVTLSGEVGSEDQRLALIAAASEVTGVVAVEPDITVR